MASVATQTRPSDIMEHQKHSGKHPLAGTELPFGPGNSKSDATNFNPPKSPARFSPSKATNSQGLAPGLAPLPNSVPLFYETVRNIHSPNSSPAPSSVGATCGITCGITSSPEATKRRETSTSPLMPMAAKNDSNDGDHPQESGHTVSPTSGAFHPSHAASYQRSFQRQHFPAQPYYSAHSAPPQEQQYAPPAPYGQRPGPGPGPGFMGQYVASQPSLSMALQSSPQFGYSHSFGHPGMHSQDASSIAMPFSPPHNRGYAYPHPPRPSSEAHTGDRSTIPGRAYGGPSSPFAEAAGAAQQPGPASPPSTAHVPHHGYSSVHYPQAASPPHYTGYSAHSFGHSSPALYSFMPPPGTYPQSFYGHQPASPEDVSKGGAWWYMPPGNTQQYDSPAYQSGYPMAGYQPSMQMTRPEFDPYSTPAQPGPSSPPPFAGPSNQPLRPPLVARDRPLLPSPSVAARPASAPRADVVSPFSKKRSPLGTTSASPPAASRKSYHPNPPPNRSEWVMWVGNVPSDATHDELWRFFNQPAPAPSTGTSAVLSSRQVRGDDAGDVWGGVASVFLISRSNCAFVNFETERHLVRAVAHFNGKPIHPRDPRCPRLVCRVRRKDDDLKAGVGGQRGMGLHTRWVAEQKERGQEKGRGRERELERAQQEREKGGCESGEGFEDTESSGDGPPTSPSLYLAPSSSSNPSPPMAAVLPIPVPISGFQHSAGDRELRHESSGNQSFTSTNSSFLASNFPKRYFILKSLTQYDLNLSLDRGIWATQPHNEGILDQAYRTSTDVFLIFGANKSGEFFGYARMAGPIFHSERVDHVSWASRSSGQGSGSRGPEVIKEEDEPSNVLSPTEHRLVDESPAPVTPGEDARLHQLSLSRTHAASKLRTSTTASFELHLPLKAVQDIESLPERRKRTALDVPTKAVTEGHLLSLKKQAHPAMTRVQRDTPGKMVSISDDDGVLRKDTLVTTEASRRQRGKDTARAVDAPAAAGAAELATPPRTEHKEQGERPPAEDKPEGWGREFKIEWVRTERLPFHRTRHLRNPWNHDREVKVSRDGTELEPGVGQRLLDEWDKPAAEVETSPPASPAGRGRGPKPPARTASVATTSTPPLPSLASRAGASGQGRGRGTPQL